MNRERKAPLNESLLQREWQRKYSTKAVKQFLRPAVACESCGEGMDIDPITGNQDYVMNERERKWSVHDKCKQDMMDQLDRSMNAGY